jgi:hypothetical protein
MPTASDGSYGCWLASAGPRRSWRGDAGQVPAPGFCLLFSASEQRAAYSHSYSNSLTGLNAGLGGRGPCGKPVTDDLQATLVELLELYHESKQCHWNLRGPLYLPLHEQLQERLNTPTCWPSACCKWATPSMGAPPR